MPSSNGIQSGLVASHQFRVALDLAQRAGLPMVRLRPGTNRPSLTEWPQRATNDPVTLVEQCAESPDSNWGVLTGSGVGVIDIDTKSDPQGYGGYASIIDLEELVDLSGWEPPRVRTASGEHWYFRYDGTLPTMIGWLPHLDVMADGGRHVAAPGTVREIDGCEVIYELVRGDLAAIPPAPNALLAAMRSWRVRSTTLTASGALRTTGDLPTDEEVLANGIEPGNRNNTLHDLAVRWWSQLRSPVAVWDMAWRVWEVTPKEPPHPPFDKREVETLVESARRYIERDDDRSASFIRAWMEMRRGR